MSRPALPPSLAIFCAEAWPWPEPFGRWRWARARFEYVREHPETELDPVALLAASRQARRAAMAAGILPGELA